MLLWVVGDGERENSNSKTLFYKDCSLSFGQSERERENSNSKLYFTRTVV